MGGLSLSIFFVLSCVVFSMRDILDCGLVSYFHLCSSLFSVRRLLYLAAGGGPGLQAGMEDATTREEVGIEEKVTFTATCSWGKPLPTQERDQSSDFQAQAE